MTQPDPNTFPASTFLSDAGSWASLAGIVLGLASLWISWLAYKEAKESAKQSKDAKITSHSVLNKLGTFSRVVEFKDALSSLSEIRTLARNSTFSPIPDKIDRIVSSLLRVKSAEENTAVSSVTVQDSIQALRALQGEVELFNLTENGQISTLDILKNLTSTADVLEPLLIELNTKLQSELS